jgi:hypothetical protein
MMRRDESFLSNRLVTGLMLSHLKELIQAIELGIFI